VTLYFVLFYGHGKVDRNAPELENKESRQLHFQVVASLPTEVFSLERLYCS
jgi:hypothetical protein